MSRKVPYLQHGALPKQQRSSQDPHQPMTSALYKPADLRPDTFEKTTDAYMYDVIFTYFSQDKDFRSRWNVVGFMAGVPDKTQKQACRQCGRAYESLKEDVCQHCKAKREMGRAPIRVVMDMPSLTETLPRSYPPVVPGRNKPKMIPGLPIGYNVPLEAYTVEDGRILLERQKQFNNDQIDPRFKWLQDIMDEYDDKVAGADRQKDEPKVSNATSFLWSQLTGMMSSGPKRPCENPLTDADKIEIAQNSLVNTYGIDKLANKPFCRPPATPAPAPVSSESGATDDAGDDLDQQLEDLLKRTAVRPSVPE